MKYHTFRGKRYRIIVTDEIDDGYLGSCDDPNKKTTPRIVIKQSQSFEEFMATGLHEALHATLWDLSEQAVIEVERDVARFIMRLMRTWLENNKDG